MGILLKWLDLGDLLFLYSHFQFLQQQILYLKNHIEQHHLIPLFYLNHLSQYKYMF